MAGCITSNDVFCLINECCSSFPETYKLASTVADTILMLASESESYRERNENGDAGSLLDFSHSQKMPLIVVPDLHGRYDFLQNLLCFSLEAGKTVTDLLIEKKVRVVCLGDGMHAESRARERWIRAYFKYIEGDVDSAEMREEMRENLSTMMSVMTLKLLFPENFHFLKGNHENIMNRMGDGDYPFCKFAEESTMTHDFMVKVYGETLVEAMGEAEDCLPLVAMFENCVLSHAEPARVFTRHELVNARLIGGIVGDLTWTANGDAAEGSVEGTLKNLLSRTDAAYIGGHRVVSEKFALRQGGKYIQIHNPNCQNIAVVMPDSSFNPETDIFSVQ